jgi:hypothetical protein
MFNDYNCQGFMVCMVMDFFDFKTMDHMLIIFMLIIVLLTKMFYGVLLQILEM